MLEGRHELDRVRGDLLGGERRWGLAEGQTESEDVLVARVRAELGVELVDVGQIDAVAAAAGPNAAPRSTRDVVDRRMSLRGVAPARARPLLAATDPLLQ